jgi:hypothetical protein
MDKRYYDGFRNAAHRIVNAQNSFLETLMVLGNINERQAMVAFSLMRKLKSVKLDAVGGRYSVKHGAYLDRDVIRRAAGIGGE